MAKAIASYFATVGMDVDPKAIARVDEFLGKLKQRLEKFQKYANDQKALQFTGSLRYRETRTNINTQLAKIGENLVLPIKKVKVVGKDAKAGIEGSLSKTAFNIRVNGRLTRESLEYMKAQLHGAFANTTFNVRPRVHIPNNMPRKAGGSGSGGGGWLGGLGQMFGGGGKKGGANPLSMLTSAGSMLGKGRFALGAPGLLMGGASAINGLASMSMSVLSAPFKAIGSLLDATSNSLIRAGTRAIPIIGGAYGLGQLNKANSEYIAQRNSTNAIFSSGDYGVTGDQARTWLYNSAQRDGYNFKDALPSFNSFMASAMPSRGYEKSRSVFEAFTQFGRTRGADSESMKGALYALSQMASKGQIMSEELNQQLAEKTGFSEAKGIFAEAWQLSLAKGGKPALTGEKAITALGDAMKKGLVKFDLIADHVEKLLRERAASGLEASRTSSAAAQARFENSRNKFLEVFSDNGGEAGFTTFWQTVAQGMERITSMAPQLGAYFKAASEAVSAVFLGITEIYDFVTTGEMTSIAKWLQDNGFDVQQLREDLKALFEDLKKTFGDIFGEGSIMDRAKALLRAVFDTGLIQEYATYLAQTAKIFGSLAGAIQAVFDGRFGDALGYIKDAGGAYVDRLGTSIRMASGTTEAVSAVMQGASYQSPLQKSFESDSARIKSDPSGFYDDQPFWAKRGMNEADWLVWKQKQLDSTARSMSATSGVNIPMPTSNWTPTGPFKLNAPAIPEPWSPGNLSVPPLSAMTADPTRNALEDVAKSLTNQSVRHQIDLKLNLNVDVKTDESEMGLKMADAVKAEVGNALGAQLQSVITNIPKY